MRDTKAKLNDNVLREPYQPCRIAVTVPYEVAILTNSNQIFLAVPPRIKFGVGHMLI
jgi:hypothetical protein